MTVSERRKYGIFTRLDNLLPPIDQAGVDAFPAQFTIEQSFDDTFEITMQFEKNDSAIQSAIEIFSLREQMYTSLVKTFEPDQPVRLLALAVPNNIATQIMDNFAENTVCYITTNDISDRSMILAYDVETDPLNSQVRFTPYCLQETQFLSLLGIPETDSSTSRKLLSSSNKRTTFIDAYGVKLFDESTSARGKLTGCGERKMTVNNQQLRARIDTLLMHALDSVHRWEFEETSAHLRGLMGIDHAKGSEWFGPNGETHLIEPTSAALNCNRNDVTFIEGSHRKEVFHFKLPDLKTVLDQVLLDCDLHKTKYDVWDDHNYPQLGICQKLWTAEGVGLISENNHLYWVHKKFCNNVVY